MSFLSKISMNVTPYLTDDASSVTALTIGNHEIHSLEELREHFQLEEIMDAFEDQILEQWLQYMFYEEQATQVKQLSIDDENAGRKLCRILGVTYEDVICMSEEEKALWEQKKALIRQYTNDEKVLDHLSSVALNQPELARLLHAETTTIYLCHGSFTIPLSTPNIHYIGIGNPVINNPFTKEQYKRARITVENIELPMEENPKTRDYALEIAKKNGYDDFLEKHHALCTAFHNHLQSSPYIDYFHLPQPAISSCMEFKSKSDCTAARNSCIKKAYQQAENYLKPRNSSCVANSQAKQYSDMITDCFSPVWDTLKNYCQFTNQTHSYEQLYELVENSQKQLLHSFEAELLDSGDYYKMYDISYFYDQAEIEEHDYRITDDSEPFFKLVETVFAKNIEYSFSPFEAISEIEKDLNEYLYTFSKATYSEYKRYVEKIENVLQGIKVVDVPRNEDEDLWEYVRRVCVVQAS